MIHINSTLAPFAVDLNHSSLGAGFLPVLQPARQRMLSMKRFMSHASEDKAIVFSTTPSLPEEPADSGPLPRPQREEDQS